MFLQVPLLGLILGVVASQQTGYQGNGTSFRPIITQAQQERICADLCQAGLGGEPCGQVCFDLMPSGIPFQSQLPVDDINGERAKSRRVKTRSSACPILCDNRLGYPLCQCPNAASPSAPPYDPQHFRVDFQQICDYYCNHQNWILRGCSCDNSAAKQHGPRPLFLQDGDGAPLSKMLNTAATSFQAVQNRQIDWEKWCHEQCAHSNGGSACNCDILPFSLH